MQPTKNSNVHILHLLSSTHRKWVVSQQHYCILKSSGIMIVLTVVDVSEKLTASIYTVLLSMMIRISRPWRWRKHVPSNTETSYHGIQPIYFLPNCKELWLMSSCNSMQHTEHHFVQFNIQLYLSMLPSAVTACDLKSTWSFKHHVQLFIRCHSTQASTNTTSTAMSASTL